ncbi:ABC transporter permease [Agrobacterium sp. Azo12]|uniref:ABC transporter permease n=1 Tax=Agrobacterium sp. Azo12 TaxID=3031129 RepID=UPI0023D7BED8|nr:ABC transporter permease [Agrobacterium sp. Azo12]MDO5895909.1 ABC transporter permease [Agrobacterium sp. Azo12]
MAVIIPEKTGFVGVKPDKPGIVIALMLVGGAFGLPFVILRPNRIVAGEALSIFQSLPVSLMTALACLLVVTALAMSIKIAAALRLGLVAVTLALLVVAAGMAASFVMPEGNSYARVSPGSGVWVLLAALLLATADCVTRLRPHPLFRIVLLVFGFAGAAAVLMTGVWDNLSIMKEYANRADVFWREGARHITLAAGSLAAAIVVGLPLGIVAHRVTALRSAVLNTLNMIQTIPSIALFAILIAPLGWIAVNVPGASALGIAGIGAAPAFVALFLYSLLPVVANTVAGLAGVPQSITEAAKGVGMTRGQRLLGVEMPLAAPVILTGIRIVLVQNIGMATIAALIGGGGFGVFVFQGVGQMAMDLVLLGAIPTVALAFAGAIIFDALIELSARKEGGSATA